MDDPIKDIEDKDGQENLGALMSRIYIGALIETGSLVTAFWTTAAVWVGMSKQSELTEEGNGDSDST